jgi:hypothetical protein
MSTDASQNRKEKLAKIVHQNYGKGIKRENVLFYNSFETIW